MLEGLKTIGVIVTLTAGTCAFIATRGQVPVVTIVSSSSSSGPSVGIDTPAGPLTNAAVPLVLDTGFCKKWLAPFKTTTCNALEIRAKGFVPIAPVLDIKGTDPRTCLLRENDRCLIRGHKMTLE